MPRLRDLGIAIGSLPAGPLNAITDVAGVRVGHHTVIEDAPLVRRTGVSVVLPCRIYEEQVFAGFFSFNGFGEMGGTHYVAETGLLASPIATTSTFSLGTLRDAMIRHRLRHPGAQGLQPLVAETNDSWLSDPEAPGLGAEALEAAIAAATGGPVAEGSVGGGTGMICHGFKGGIGTASRQVRAAGEGFTVGALVQANYGRRAELTIAGWPAGRAWAKDPPPPRPGDGSIIIVVATDAPLMPVHCQRLARRAAVGLGRVGGHGANGSGDLFLAFATGNRLPIGAGSRWHGLDLLPPADQTPLFQATAEAVEEAIVNALCAAATMTGMAGRTVHGLPVERLRQHFAGNP
ncbi:MAG: P1 family peptidase [Thalassobaculales bacterium]